MSWIPTEQEALELLKKEKASEAVINHTKAVTELVKKLIRGLKVDRKIAIAGAVLHDIGRSKTHGVKHGVVGARILKEQNIDERIVSIVETHVGAGIPKKEGANLGLPNKDLIPKTLEEKIVCYADKLLIGTYVATEDEALYEFKKKLGVNHPAIKRMESLFQEVKEIRRKKT